MPTSMPPMRSTSSLRPARPSSCSAWWRSRRSRPRCCTGRRSPGSASSAPMSRRCWSPRERPDYWSLYIYLAVVTAAAFALARFRLWRWLAITAIAFSALWTLPGIGVVSVEALGAHAFHVVVGFALAATLIVSGLLFGPDARARPDRRRVVGGARRLSAGRDPVWCWRAGTIRSRSRPSPRSSPRRLRSPGARKRRPPRCRRPRCSPCS